MKTQHSQLLHDTELNINQQVYKTQLCRGQLAPKLSVNVKVSQTPPPYQDYTDQNYRRIGLDDICGDTVECPQVGFGAHARGRTGGSGGVLLVLSYILALLTFPISLYFCIIIVPQFKRLIVYRNGKILNMRARGPGIVPTLPCIDEKQQVDLRTKGFCIPPQDVITKDTMTVLVDGVLFWRVADPMSAVCNIGDYTSAVQTLAGSALRNAVGTKDLTEIIKNRPGVSQEILEQMKTLTQMWGIKIVRAEIKSIRMPIQMQKIMAQEADMQKQANAKISLAQAEIETVKNLQMATLILNQNPMGMQLRYLQTLHLISGEKSKTIVMPFSLDILRIIKRILVQQRKETSTENLPDNYEEQDSDDEDECIDREQIYEDVNRTCTFSCPATNTSESATETIYCQDPDDLDYTIRRTLDHLLEEY